MKFMRLPIDLEMGAISAMAAGKIDPGSVEDSELSETGKAFKAATQYLTVERGQGGVYDLATLAQTAIHLKGLDKDSVYAYIKKALDFPCGKEITEVIGILRTQQHLNMVSDAVSAQLESRVFDRAALLSVIDKKKIEVALQPAVDLLKDGLPPLPTGIPLDGLPMLTERTGGMFGLWAIGGESMTGKTTLGMQIALIVAQHRPVLYYDLENGDTNLLHRIGMAFEGDLEKTREAVRQLYIRHNPNNLEADITTVSQPCLVVVDSLQKLPTKAEYKTAGLDKWLRRLEAQKENGHYIIVLSEKNRDSYGKSEMGGYRGTAEVEYTADIGIQLQRDKGEDFVQLHIVKNRHREHLGYQFDLERQNAWLVRERETTEDLSHERMETVRAGSGKAGWRQTFPGEPRRED